tara:strand:- start:5340 stop:5570 length:231 start_codon:yes stop_codon:yes gene_type:complete
MIDPSYLKWLVAQTWFKESNQNLIDILDRDKKIEQYTMEGKKQIEIIKKAKSLGISIDEISTWDADEEEKILLRCT